MLRVEPREVGAPERDELEFVLAHLERTPKLASLLQFMVEKYLAGNADELTEYIIATEVFGRPRASFIASEDSVARVQTHRLRKRLKEIYQGEGRDHCIEVAIPLGTYIPTLLRRDGEGGAGGLNGLDRLPALINGAVLNDSGAGRSAAAHGSLEEPAGFLARAEEDAARVSTPARGGDAGRAAEGVEGAWRKWAGWVFTLGMLALLCLGLAWRYRLQGARRAELSQAASEADAQTVPAAGAGVALPFRMLAGYDGPPQRDSKGNLWGPDRYFRNGWAVKRPAVFVARTSDPLIFRYGREGDSDYDIPLAPGVYELHLYFFEPSEALQSEDAENKSVFNVTINGEIRLLNFDVVSDGDGRNVGDERVLRDISPAADGKLHIHINQYGDWDAGAERDGDTAGHAASTAAHPDGDAAYSLYGPEREGVGAG